MTKFDNYPYVIHTNRELELMLAGKKPLAVFAHERVDGFEKWDALADQDFDTHVAKGVFSENMRTFSCRTRDGFGFNIDYYFYTLPGEEWRVEAFCLLLKMRERRQWCAQLERLEGELLGYTDEQNDYHLSREYPEKS